MYYGTTAFEWVYIGLQCRLCLALLQSSGSRWPSVSDAHCYRWHRMTTVRAPDFHETPLHCLLLESFHNYRYILQEKNFPLYGFGEFIWEFVGYDWTEMTGMYGAIRNDERFVFSSCTHLPSQISSRSWTENTEKFDKFIESGPKGRMEAWTRDEEKFRELQPHISAGRYDADYGWKCESCTNRSHSSITKQQNCTAVSIRLRGKCCVTDPHFKLFKSMAAF